MEKQVAILLHPRDDVATALTDLAAGHAVAVALENVAVEVVLREDIPFGHKLALRDSAAGEEVPKY